MGFNRRKGISVVAAIMVLVLLTVVVFLAPIYRGVTFWLGYSFAVLATILTACTFIFVSDAENRSKTFLRLSIGAAAWIYFIIQMAVSIEQIGDFFIPYLTALILDCGITFVFVIILLSTRIAAEEIERQDVEVAKKVDYLKELRLTLSTLKTNDTELKGKIEKLAEDVQFSDPMSHSELADTESEILEKAKGLKDVLSDREKALETVESISDMLKVRNERCKMLKNKPEPKPQRDNRGVKYVGVALGIVALLGAVALTAVFYILPQTKYNEATKLYNEGQYAESIIAFEEIESYKDSKQMIEKAQIALKDEVYDAAKQLLDSGDYLGAIAAFEELEGYRDSKERIEEIKELIRSDLYDAATEYYNTQNYVEALKLYTELKDYKDSVQKIEDIKSKLEQKDKVFYFGTFRGKPIAWQIVDVTNTFYTLTTADTLVDMAYNDELANVGWNESTLRKWLNSEFLESFTNSQKESMRTVNIDGSDAMVYLINENDANRLKGKDYLSLGSAWWLRTKNGTMAMYVDANGSLIKGGEVVTRALGVRPCIQIDMKKSEW